MKYKVGDKVKLVGDKNSVRTKACAYGSIGEISNVAKGLMYPYLVEINRGFDGHRWRDTELEPVTANQKIVIITDGKTTTAKLFEDNKVIKTAEAKCNPADTFDFKTGAEIAFNRLVGKPCGMEAPKSKYYNGKVVCVNSGNIPECLTVGRIYTFVNGIGCDDCGGGHLITHRPVIDVNDLNDRFFSEVKFIELVED